MDSFYILLTIIGWILLFFVNLGLSSAYVDRYNPLVHHENLATWYTTQLYLVSISILGPLSLPWIFVWAGSGKYGFKIKQGEDDPDSRWFNRLLRVKREAAARSSLKQGRRGTVSMSMYLRTVMARNGDRLRRMVAEAEGNIISIWE